MAFRLSIGEQVHEIEIVSRKPRLVVRIDGRLREVEGDLASGDGRHLLRLDDIGTPVLRARTGDTQHVRFSGRSFDIRLVDPRADARSADGGQDRIRAPMPGAVVSVQKQAGDTVSRGETVLTIESMKLQTALGAPRDGILLEVLKSEGETFEKDEIVASLAPLNKDE